MKSTTYSRNSGGFWTNFKFGEGIAKTRVKKVFIFSAFTMTSKLSYFDYRQIKYDLTDKSSSPTAAPEAAKRIERVLTTDPGMGIIRHADAGYEEAIEFAEKNDVRIPMKFDK